MPTHLAFVTDSQRHHLDAVASLVGVFVHACAKHGTTTWVVVPDEARAQCDELLSRRCGLNAPNVLGATSSTDDPYYIQLGLTQVFQRLSPNEYILCLDYDHIVFDPIHALTFQCEGGTIILSSEPVPRPAVDCLKQLSPFDAADDGHAVFGASYIAGKARDLAAIGACWHGAYSDLSRVTGVRHRVELALNLAGARSGIRVLPCPLELQSSYYMSSQKPALFHYGGNSRESMAMKEQLQRLAIEQCEVIGSSPLSQLHEELKNTLEGQLTLRNQAK